MQMTIQEKETEEKRLDINLDDSTSSFQFIFFLKRIYMI